MGCVTSLFRRFTRSFTYVFDADELTFHTAGTINCIGDERKSAGKMWEDTLKFTAADEMRTRCLLLPVLDTRIRLKQNSHKYHDQVINVDELKKTFPKWTEEDILDMVDLFDTFDKKNQGLMSPLVFARWLDNLGDTTDYVARAALLMTLKDETRYIHLEKFLNLVGFFEANVGTTHSIVSALRRGSTLIRKLRALNATQQVYTGLS